MAGCWIHTLPAVRVWGEEMVVAAAAAVTSATTELVAVAGEAARGLPIQWWVVATVWVAIVVMLVVEVVLVVSKVP